MTNQERNIRLGVLLGFLVKENKESMFTWDKYLIPHRGGWRGLPDYCENWSELMPLVVEHNIVYTRDIDITTFAAYLYSPTSNAFDSHQPHFTPNTDLRIALVDCLISVLEAKQLNPTQE